MTVQILTWEQTVFLLGLKTHIKKLINDEVFDAPAWQIVLKLHNHELHQLVEGTSKRDLAVVRIRQRLIVSGDWKKFEVVE